jgi:EAL domain-containing protein (putative c-di-GMP-specific phosphodiesterase class I)
VAAETLVRWQHPTRGQLGPNEFIPIAEQSDLIIDVTRWVVSQSVKQIADWAKKGFAVNLSVNLSGKDLESTGLLVEHLNQITSQYQIDTSLLELEITESILMADPETSRRELLKLKDLGYTLAIDDFGTGYSSLNYLKNLPVDTLKIDQIFIKGIAEGDEDYSIAKGIIALANSLQLTTIAEGVETQEQRDLISGLGCNIIQGYLISKPLSLDIFEKRYLSQFQQTEDRPKSPV